MRNWLLASLFLLILIALLAAQPMAVWDGNFKLDIAIKTDSTIAGESETESLPSRIDANSILIATAWNAIERDAMLTENSSEGFGFRVPTSKENGQLEISVPCSGREGRLGFYSTYNQPKFVVVEFRIIGASSEFPLRKSFLMPEGRGRKSMTIELP